MSEGRCWTGAKARSFGPTRDNIITYGLLAAEPTMDYLSAIDRLLTLTDFERKSRGG